jgi:hypothetical protein
MRKHIIPIVITLTVIAGTVLWFADSALSATYVVEKGDGWERITKNVSFVSGLKYKQETLQEINFQIKELKPGQKIDYLSRQEIVQAAKWVDLCIAAGYTDPIYKEDQKNLVDGIIKENAVRRFINYAEAYRLGVRPPTTR